MLDALKTVLELALEDTGILASLAIAVVVLMYSHVHIWLSCRGRLADKDKHIADLIDQRNKLQDILFSQQGRRRLTSREEES